MLVPKTLLYACQRTEGCLSLRRIHTPSRVSPQTPCHGRLSQTMPEPWFGTDSSYCNWRDVLQKPSCLEAWKKKQLSLGAARCAEFYPSTDEKEADVKVRICNSSTPPVRWKTEIAGWLKSLSTSFSQLLNGAETNKVERWTSLLKVVFWPPRHGACVQIDEACATLSCVLPLTRRLSIINAFFKPGISSWLR